MRYLLDDKRHPQRGHHRVFPSLPSPCLLSGGFPAAACGLARRLAPFSPYHRAGIRELSPEQLAKGGWSNSRVSSRMPAVSRRGSTSGRHRRHPRPADAAREGPQVGDRLRLRGARTKASFAPCVTARTVKRIGTGPLPDPQPFDLSINDSRGLDGQWVQAQGDHSNRPVGSRFNVHRRHQRARPRRPEDTGGRIDIARAAGCGTKRSVPGACAWRRSRIDSSLTCPPSCFQVAEKAAANVDEPADGSKCGTDDRSLVCSRLDPIPARGA